MCVDGQWFREFVVLLVLGLILSLSVRRFCFLLLIPFDSPTLCGGQLIMPEDMEKFNMCRKRRPITKESAMATVQCNYCHKRGHMKFIATRD